MAHAGDASHRALRRHARRPAPDDQLPLGRPEDLREAARVPLRARSPARGQLCVRGVGRRGRSDRAAVDRPAGAAVDPIMAETTRREFIKAVAVGGTAATALSSGVPGAAEADAASDWKAHIGLELYTVRDQIAANFEGVLAKVAAMGYKEIEPANGYNDMSPAQFRAMLDRLGLSMPSTHSGASGTEAEVEKQLAGFQAMGIK